MVHVHETAMSNADSRALAQVDDISYMLAHDELWMEAAQRFDDEVHGREQGDRTPSRDLSVRYSVLSAEGLLIAIRLRYDGQNTGLTECRATTVEGRRLFEWKPIDVYGTPSRRVFIDEPLHVANEAYRGLNGDPVTALANRHASYEALNDTTRFVVPVHDERHLLVAGNRYVRTYDTQSALAQAAIVRDKGWLSDDSERFWDIEPEEYTMAQVIDINV